MLADARNVTDLGRDDAPLVVREGEKDQRAWAGRRMLHWSGTPIYELSFWCGTCPFLFERLQGANTKLSIDSLTGKLNTGLDAVDDEVVSAFSQLLPRGRYLPLLLRIKPRRAVPGSEEDYFSHEQLDTWRVDAFWGLPENPRVPYYRTFEAPLSDSAHLYEFVVPMVPETWNDAKQVEAHRSALRESFLPTAVSLALLDIRAPAVDEGPDYYEHWGLTHFLLDGHHKMQAAAESGAELQLLALLSLDQSLAPEEEVQRIPALRSSEPRARAAAN